MAARVPLEVGARGTIGSLLKREIEYFRRLDVERVGSHVGSERECSEQERARKGCGYQWPGLRFLTVSWRKKKRKNSGILRPGICSMVEVADSQRMSEIPGLSYRNLKADSKRSEASETS